MSIEQLVLLIAFVIATLVQAARQTSREAERRGRAGSAVDASDADSREARPELAERLEEERRAAGERALAERLREERRSAEARARQARASEAQAERRAAPERRAAAPSLAERRREERRAAGARGLIERLGGDAAAASEQVEARRERAAPPRKLARDAPRASLRHEISDATAAPRAHPLRGLASDRGRVRRAIVLATLLGPPRALKPATELDARER